jgi:hypothetical protein
MRLQTLSLPADGWEFALVVDQCDDDSETTVCQFRDFACSIGAKSVMVTAQTVEIP